MKRILIIIWMILFLLSFQIPANASTQCHAKLNNKIILIVSQYCSQCKKVLPIVENIVEQNKLEKDFRLLNINNKVDREFIRAHNIHLQYVPTLIVDCYYYVGAKNENEYKEIFNSRQEK